MIDKTHHRQNIVETEMEWNEIELSMPALFNYEISRKNFNIESFKKIFENAINYFTNLKGFNAEVEQITQFIYLEREAFHMLRGFHEMKKTQQAANRYLRMDISGVFEAFNSFISDEDKSIVSIPYRQNLDYVLIKLQGLSKLLIRLVTCARKSARYFLGFIRHGSFYVKGTVYVASLAKLWDMSRSMCNYVVTIYNQLIQYRDQLRVNENINWINCLLPDKLDEWLGSVYYQFITNDTYDLKMLTKEEEIETFIKKNLNILKIFSENVNDEKLNQVSSNLQEFKIESQDENELEDYTPIPREIKIEYDHSISKISTKEHIKQFIKTEDKLRKIDTKNSLTIKKINKKEWKNFKNDIKTKLLLMQENSLIEYVQDNLNDYLK